MMIIRASGFLLADDLRANAFRVCRAENRHPGEYGAGFPIML
jgi:hypothetical protein